MANSTRGGKTVYEKQQSTIDQFDRVNRQARYDEKYGKRNLSVTEQLIQEAQLRKAKAANKPKREKIIFSSRHIHEFVYGNKLSK